MMGASCASSCAVLISDSAFRKQVLARKVSHPAQYHTKQQARSDPKLTEGRGDIHRFRGPPSGPTVGPRLAFASLRNLVQT